MFLIRFLYSRPLDTRAMQYIHRGKQLEHAVQKTGYPCSKLATLLGMSRTTLYRYFAKEDPGSDFIKRVAEIINCDVNTLLNLPLQNIEDLVFELQNTYIELLQEQDKLVATCFRLCNEESSSPEKRVRIQQFLSDFFINST